MEGKIFRIILAAFIMVLSWLILANCAHPSTAESEDKRPSKCAFIEEKRGCEVYLCKTSGLPFDRYFVWSVCAGSNSSVDVID